MASYLVTQHDRRTVTFTCKSDGSAYDLSGASEVLLCRVSPAGTTEYFSTVDDPTVLAFTSDGTDGKVALTPDGGFWSASNGNYRIWLRAEYSSGAPQRFPDTGEHTFVINGAT